MGKKSVRALALLMTTLFLMGILCAPAMANTKQVKVKVTYTLQNDGGKVTELAKPIILSGTPGKKYKIDAVSISGYKMIAQNDPNKGVFGKTDSIVDIKYVKKDAAQVSVTIKSVVAETGKSAGKNQTFKCYVGAPVYYYPEAIKGYNQPDPVLIVAQGKKDVIEIMYYMAGTASKNEEPAEEKTSANQQDSSAQAKESDQGGQVEKDMLAMLNDHREANGVAALSVNKELMQAAAVRAKELAEEFSHTRPDGTDCFTASSKIDGENIAYRSPYNLAKTYTNWKNSPGHNKNMLNASFKSVGVGYYCKGNDHYFVQLFGEGK